MFTKYLLLGAVRVGIVIVGIVTLKCLIAFPVVDSLTLSFGLVGAILWTIDATIQDIPSSEWTESESK